ncbi:MAG: hypothetical protein WC511_01655 [Candidatus Pacearchaeota archaeon]
MYLEIKYTDLETIAKLAMCAIKALREEEDTEKLERAKKQSPKGFWGRLSFHWQYSNKPSYQEPTEEQLKNALHQGYLQGPYWMANYPSKKYEVMYDTLSSIILGKISGTEYVFISNEELTGILSFLSEQEIKDFQDSREKVEYHSNIARRFTKLLNEL